MKRTVIAMSCLLACSSTETAETSKDKPTPQTPVNGAPLWTDAPSGSVAIGQGQTREVPLSVSDDDGDDVTIFLNAPPEVEVTYADGNLSVFVGYLVSGPVTIVVTLTDEHGESSETELSLDVEPYGWTDYQTWKFGDGPEEREHATVLFDEASGSAFMFGGSGYYPQFTQTLHDFWRYDSDGSWHAITATGAPPDHGGSRRYAGGLIFGGYSVGNTLFNELLSVRVDGDTLHFDSVEQLDAPPARALHTFAYDAATDRYILFGGYGFGPSGATVFGDTWTMRIVDGVAQWTELSLDVAPTGRYGSFYGVDDERGRLLLFSGAQTLQAVSPAPDTWALDMRADPPQWTLLLGQEASPPGRRNGCAVFDPTGPRLVVFGGTSDAATTQPGAFALDARPGHEAWSSLPIDHTVPPRSSGFGFFDGARVVMGFGNDAVRYRDWGILGY